MIKLSESTKILYRMLAFSWLALCCTSCEPVDDGSYSSSYFYTTTLCAYKPDSVDGMEIHVTYQADNSVWADSATWTAKRENRDYTSRDHDNVCLDCWDKCKDIFPSSKGNKISVDITFECDDKTIALPTFVIDKSIINWGEDRIDFRFVELDERSIHGAYSVETFIPPEDTSCGKFVNYAVLRLP